MPDVRKETDCLGVVKSCRQALGAQDTAFGRANCPTHRGVSYLAGQISVAKAINRWITISEGGHLRCLLHDLL